MKTLKLLIYDDQCFYCRKFKEIITRLSRTQDFVFLPFDDEKVQKVLQAQFGSSPGFTMYFFDQARGEVSWGRDAAKRVLEALSLPRWLASFAFWIYPSLVRFVSILTRRKRTVCAPEVGKCIGIGGQVPKDSGSAAQIRKESLSLLLQIFTAGENLS